MRGNEKMNIVKTKDYETMSGEACELVAQRLRTLTDPVLGLATGSTPEGMYQCLINQYKEQQISFKNVTTFNLDEYIGLAADDPNSYQYFMNENFFKHIDIQENKTHLPNGVAPNLKKECTDYEQKITDAGGIDLQVLGLGTNGHIAFNEPGTDFNGRTDIVDLAQATLDANARFFDSIEDVPTQALTMGIQSIMEAKEIILLVSGEQKADALAEVINGDVTEAFPASILQKHNNVTIIADEAALAKA